MVIIVAAYLLFCIGFAMAQPDLAWDFVAIAGAFIVLCIVAVPKNLRLSRKYQREIDEVDALPRS